MIRSIFSGKYSAAAGRGGIFETFFGGGATTDREGRQRGSDLRYDMQITLEEAAFGVEKEIELRKLDTCGKCEGKGADPGSRTVNCPTCGGRGQVISSRGFFQVSQTCPRCRGVGQIIEKPCRVCSGEGRVENTSRIKLKVPGGISDGSRLRTSGNGEAGIRGGPSGDLYVVIHIKEHPIFQREEDNLYCEVPIAFTVAALGGEIAVPTLEGKANLKVPAGTQSGQVFKLRGKGISQRQRARSGRSPRAASGRGAEPLEQRAAPEARRIRRALRRRKHAAPQELLRSRERIFSVN